LRVNGGRSSLGKGRKNKVAERWRGSGRRYFRNDSMLGRVKCWKGSIVGKG